MTDSAADASAQAGPGQDHDRLRPFEGTFVAQVKFWMGPGDPIESTGVMVNSLELGGRFLHQDYQGDATDGPFPQFQGKGYWGFNTVSQRYEGFWIDTASTVMQLETGTVDDSGQVWTMEGQVTNPETGQPLGKRSTIRLIDADHHSMETHFITPDGQEFKAMEIQYQRRS